MKSKNNSRLPLPVYIVSLITANVGIVISLMYLTLHFIDNVNNAMGFLRSEVTLTLLTILSIVSAITAALVLLMLHKQESKSYFFRKVAFITFWVSVLCALLRFNVILADSVSTEYSKLIWFSTSLFTMITSIFCNGLLVRNPTRKAPDVINNLQ